LAIGWLPQKGRFQEKSTGRCRGYRVAFLGVACMMLPHFCTGLPSGCIGQSPYIDWVFEEIKLLQ
jgi:hypothetical protein